MNQDLNQYVINDRSHKYLNARLELLERLNRSIDTVLGRLLPRFP